jgi:hypothetical protein
MRQRFFQCAAIASFALCLAMHILWLRSYFCTEKVEWQGSGGWRSVRTAAGHLEVGLLLADWSGQPPARFHGPKYERDQVRPPFNDLLILCSSRGDTNIDWERSGFAWYAKLNSKRGVHHSIAVVPCWFLAAITLLLPLVTTTLRLWSRRQPAK